MPFDRLHVVLGTLLLLGVGYRAIIARRPVSGATAPALERAAHAVKERSARKRESPRDPAPRSTAMAAIREEVTPAGARPPESAPRRAAGQVARARIEINDADVNALSSLPGIGPSLAARIVEDRARRGKFRSQADLQRVRGIGERLAARLAAYVTFDGSGRPTGEDSGAGQSVRKGTEKSRRGRSRSSEG